MTRAVVPKLHSRSCASDPTSRILQARSYRPDPTGCIHGPNPVRGPRGQDAPSRWHRGRINGTAPAQEIPRSSERFREPNGPQIRVAQSGCAPGSTGIPSGLQTGSNPAPPGTHPASSIPAVSLLPCSSSTTGLRGRFSFSLVRLRSIVRRQSIVRRRPQRIAPVDVYGARRLPSADRAPLPRLPLPRTAGGPAGPPRREPRRPAGAGSRRTKPVHALFDHRLLPA